MRKWFIAALISLGITGMVLAQEHTPPTIQAILSGNYDFTGQIKAADGTAAAPSQTYASDLDLGSYRIGADNEGFSAGGVLRWDYNTTRILSTIPFQSSSASDSYFSGDLAVGATTAGTRLWVNTGVDRNLAVRPATDLLSGSGGIGLSASNDANNANQPLVFAASAYTFTGASIISQLEGTTAQTYRLYETFTDSTNYERGEIVMGSDTMTIRTGTAGTGADNLDVALTASGTGGVNATGRFSYSTREAITVDAATTFAVTSSYITLACTGAETINTITGGKTGMELVIEHTDTDCTIADDDDPTAANAVDLTGVATNDVGAAKKIITLRYNGTDWLQVGESDN